MNRRGHLSNKIPNVKLRPAPAATASTSRGKRKSEADEQQTNAMDEEILRKAWLGAEDDGSSSAAMRTNERPWAKVVITFTGVENKSVLAPLVKELGAQIESALTVNVSHIVATGYGSPKYLYAVEHHLPVMKPEWILDAHQRWLNGEEIDLAQSVLALRLPPFSGLRIAISGIEALDRRRQLVQYIGDNGGLYSKDLDRSCTHLISAKPTSDSKSSEKVRWALKEVAERDAGRRRGKKVEGEDIKIVYEEWVWDCVAYNGRWKEESYDARKTRRASRVTAEDVLDGTAMFDVPAVPVKEEEKDEPAVIRKRKREGMDLVGEIFSSTAVKLPIADSERSVITDEAGPSRPRPPAVGDDRKPSLLHVSRTTSFTTPELLKTPMPPPMVPSPTTLLGMDDRGEPALQQPPQFLAGLRFSHDIAEHCEGLEKALLAHGGVLVPEVERLQGAEVDYVIIRLCSTSRPAMPDAEKQATIVTECWIEGCCFEQRLLFPDDRLVFRPLPAAMPVAGAEKLLVHISGFSSSDSVYLRRLLRAIGGELSVKLNRQTSHLVLAHTVGQKYEKAHEWGVKAVKDSWLLAMGQSGFLEPDTKHLQPIPTNLPVATATRLLGKSGSTSNMSAVSILEEPFSRPTPTAFLPPPSARLPSQSGTVSASQSSRALKHMPTHIDDHDHGSVEIRLSGDDRKALSPPKIETERILNHASPRRLPSMPEKGSSPHESLDSKIARTVSAPAGPESMKSAGRGKEVTEQLRRLAQKDDITVGGRGKPARRPRPSSRFKHAPSGASPFNTSTSPSARASSPPTPDDLDDGGAARQPRDVEESMRVEYVDINAQREKRKLLAAFKATDMATSPRQGSAMGR